jgi:hypothetical protein
VYDGRAWSDVMGVDRLDWLLIGYPGGHNAASCCLPAARDDDARRPSLCRRGAV